MSNFKSSPQGFVLRRQYRHELAVDAVLESYSLITIRGRELDAVRQLMYLDRRYRNPTTALISVRKRANGELIYHTVGRPYEGEHDWRMREVTLRLYQRLRKRYAGVARRNLRGPSRGNAA